MKNTFQKGFTLIELLIVIAILGVLAAVVFAAIDPAEQFAKANDAKLKTTVGSVAQGIEANRTTRGTSVPISDSVSAGNWLGRLVNSGELNKVPTGPATANTCFEGTAPTIAAGAPVGSNVVSNQNNFCYRSNGAEYVVYTRPESKSELGKCAGSQGVYYVYSSAMGTAGTVCVTNFTSAVVDPASTTLVFK